MTKEIKNTTVAFRLPRSLRSEIEQLAELEERPLSNMLILLVKIGLTSRKGQHDEAA